jgi:sugar phosphate isomerase/epimerase
VCRLAAEWGYDGLEIACWGDHVEVDRALAERMKDTFRALNAIGYPGPISIEWADAGMDRLVGAPEALQFVRTLAFDAPSAAFDAAFSTK